MKTSDFSYILPEELIAQTPAEPRDSSRLMVLHRQDKTWKHDRFFNIGSYIRRGDILILNESKVFKARISGICNKKKVAVFLLRPENTLWSALVKPWRNIDVGSIIKFDDSFTATVIAKLENGTVTLDFSRSTENVFSFMEKNGSVPLPPYIHTTIQEKNYQTIYAKHIGSVAAPTAGFHFTPELIQQLKKKGVQFAYITLHVGLGTFRPMIHKTIEEHTMHSEWVHVSEETMEKIQKTKSQGGRVIAVGTTSVRALESGMRNGYTNIFIQPGYTFKIIDAMITNFHVPVSTLLVLISAFAGHEFVLKAYTEAIHQKYRFYSFGDAMFIE